jgi:hypothetical protein
MLRVAPEAHPAHKRPLPQLLVTENRDGHIELPTKPVFQAADYLPLVLQGTRCGDVDFQGEETDGHFRPRPERVVQLAIWRA